MQDIYGLFDFKFELLLSTRPENYVGSLDSWAQAEKSLSAALEASGHRYTVNPGDGAFYGPKIDILITDALQVSLEGKEEKERKPNLLLQRKHQCATIQLDFQLPEKFQLVFKNDQGGEDRPVMIHRAILGSLERFMAILTEHLAGRWPVWLSPRQVMILPVAERHQDYCQQVAEELNRDALPLGDSMIDSSSVPFIYVDVNKGGKTISKMIRTAQMQQYNFMLVIGDEEVSSNLLTVRDRDGNLLEPMSVTSFASKVRQLIRDRK